MFSEIGKETKVLVRFSTVGGERICGYRESSQRFCKVLYGRRGGILWVTMPVFSLGKKSRFYSYLKNPHQHEIPTMMWDYWSLNPRVYTRSLFCQTGEHHTDTGTWTTMVVTYSMLDDANQQRTSLKFHFKTAQGIRNFTIERRHKWKQMIWVFCSMIWWKTSTPKFSAMEFENSGNDKTGNS
jgi:catalase